MGKADYRLLVEVGVQQAVAGALVNEFSEPSVLVGYSLIIIPTGILSAEMAETRRRAVTTRACPSCMAEGHDADAVFCNRCGERLEPLPHDDR